MAEHKDLFAVIMAGGKGTRFWPLSREMFPKQYLKLFGDRTLIQETIARVEGEVPLGNVVIVTTTAQRDIVQWQAGEILDKVNCIVEPMGRNTAPAIALVTYKLHKLNPDAILLVLPSDHHIADRDAFAACLERAVPHAREGFIVTFGIRPTRPETGYGYIKTADALQGQSAYKVARFVEKPDEATAQQYLAEGTYYWNSGMFIFSAASMVEEFKRHMPGLHAAFSSIEGDLDTARETEAIERIYPSLEEQSIDYGIMERSERAAMVVADFPWSDIGSWNAIEEVLPRDERGNVKVGNVVDIDCDGSIFFTGNKLVAAIGVKDMVLVDTHDATLIVPKDRVQSVKDMVARLKREGKGEYLSPRIEERPWGFFSVLEHGPTYQIKNITVKPGARLSLQMHNHRSEHWIVVSGIAKVTRGDEETFIHQNESTFIPATWKHRLENPGRIPLTIIEIQSGEYLGEDDIIRFDDVYGRQT